MLKCCATIHYMKNPTRPLKWRQNAILTTCEFIVYHIERSSTRKPSLLKRKIILFTIPFLCALFLISAKLSCVFHFYDLHGRCRICTHEYDVEIIQFANTRFYSIRNIDRGYTPIRYRPYQEFNNTADMLSFGESIIIVGRGYNSRRNRWYKTNNGYWVYSGNISRIHPENPICVRTCNFINGRCSNCGAESIIYITPTINTLFFAKLNSYGALAPVRARPFGNYCVLYSLLPGTEIIINGYAREYRWARLSCGNWIYVDNFSNEYFLENILIKFIRIVLSMSLKLQHCTRYSIGIPLLE